MVVSAAAVDPPREHDRASFDRPRVAGRRDRARRGDALARWRRDLDRPQPAGPQRSPPVADPSAGARPGLRGRRSGHRAFRGPGRQLGHVRAAGSTAATRGRRRSIPPTPTSGTSRSAAARPPPTGVATDSRTCGVHTATGGWRSMTWGDSPELHRMPYALTTLPEQPDTVLVGSARRDAVAQRRRLRQLVASSALVLDAYCPAFKHRPPEDRTPPRHQPRAFSRARSRPRSTVLTADCVGTRLWPTMEPTVTSAAGAYGPLCTGSPARSPSPIRVVDRAPTALQLVYKRLDASGRFSDELPRLALIHRFPDVSCDPLPFLIAAHAPIVSLRPVKSTVIALSVRRLCFSVVATRSPAVGAFRPAFTSTAVGSRCCSTAARPPSFALKRGGHRPGLDRVGGAQSPPRRPFRRSPVDHLGGQFAKRTKAARDRRSQVFFFFFFKNFFSQEVGQDSPRARASDDHTV